MIERINLILKTKNFSASQFADEIGIQRSSISHILSGRNNPSLEFMMKVLSRFPDIETDWLIFGKGSMYKERKENIAAPPVLPQAEKPAQIVTVQKDLFSEEEEVLPQSEARTQADNISQIKNEMEITPQPIATSMSRQPEEVDQVLPVENAIKEEKKIEVPVESILKDEKKRIEKFVILYNDNTFAEYFPEKK